MALCGCGLLLDVACVHVFSCGSGVASNSLAGGTSNWARGWGKAGVGVKASDGSGEENAEERTPGDGCAA